MDLDFNQLPIPDWGLACPVCRYALNGLPTHRCPECGTDIDVPSLIRTWTRLRAPTYRGDERPVPDWGLECGHCRAALAGMTGDACNVCGAALAGSLAPPRQDWFVVEPWHLGGLSPAVLLQVVEGELIPHYQSNEQGVYQIYFGSRPLDQRVRVSREFYYDLLAGLAARRKQRAQRPAGAPRVCPNCEETSPPDFEVCWQCGGAL